MIFFLFHCNMKWVVKIHGWIIRIFCLSIRLGQTQKVSESEWKKFHNQIVYFVILIQIHYIHFSLLVFLFSFIFFKYFFKKTFFKWLLFSYLLSLGKQNLIQENLNPDFLFIRWRMPVENLTAKRKCSVKIDEFSRMRLGLSL